MKPLCEAETPKNGDGPTDLFIPLSVEGLQTAIQIMKNRFPQSAPCYNMAVSASRFPDLNIRAYSINADISEKAVFVLVRNRPDWGQDIDISNPNDFKETEEVRQAFSNTAAIDWRKPYMFCAIDRLISPMILSISTIDKDNGTQCNPSYAYTVNPEEAAKLEIEERHGVVTKSLDVEKGLDFIVQGWKYKKEGTREYTKELIEKGISSGVYIDGVPACAIIANWNGHIGMLYTGKDYRGKGYAKLCTHHIMKQLGMNGYAVASSVEISNKSSNKFHEAIGITKTHISDYVFTSPFTLVQQ